MWPLQKKGLFDSGRVLFLPVDVILPNPHQPRRTFVQSELEELARSIQELGLLQPLTVRRQEGRWELVAPMALGATACGADGLIIEVHNDPEHALCDGPQSLRPEKFGDMMEKIHAIRPYSDHSFTTGTPVLE